MADTRSVEVEFFGMVNRFREPTSLLAPLRRVVRFLAPYTKAGWAFAVLSPAKGS